MGPEAKRIIYYRGCTDPPPPEEEAILELFPIAECIGVC